MFSRRMLLSGVLAVAIVVCGLGISQVASASSKSHPLTVDQLVGTWNVKVRGSERDQTTGQRDSIKGTATITMTQIDATTMQLDVAPTNGTEETFNADIATNLTLSFAYTDGSGYYIIGYLVPHKGKPNRPKIKGSVMVVEQDPDSGDVFVQAMNIKGAKAPT